MKTFLLKWMFCLMAAIGLALAFSACSDDDDDKEGDPQENGQGSNPEGNGQGAGNGGSGVVVLSKKVAKITESYNGGSENVRTFTYDDQGRLSKIFYNNAATPGREFTYSENQINFTIGSRPSVITLKDGKAVSFKSGDRASSAWEEIYHYSGNYLDRINQTDYHDGEIGGTYTSSLKWKDGNWSSEEYRDEDNDYSETGIYTYEWSKYANNANIDLLRWINYGDYNEVFYLCCTGIRCQNMPSKETHTATGIEDGETYTDVTTYDYVVDKDNYITKITITYIDEEEGTSTYIYTITYK